MSETQQESLYSRLGGYDNIYLFGGEALKKAMAHPAIGHIWAHMSESTFYKEHINFVDFLSEHWGGNARYRGRDMITAHRGMGLTDEHWAAMFDCLHDTYQQFQLPQELRDEIDEFVLAHPEIDVTKGMKSVGVIWPDRRIAGPRNRPETRWSD